MNLLFISRCLLKQVRTGLQEPIVEYENKNKININITSAAGSLKIGVFTIWKLANATNQGPFFPLESGLLAHHCLFLP